MNIIDSKEFDAKLLKILKKKKRKNVVSGRFDIEGIVLSKKPDFIVAFFRSFKLIKGVTYKVLFWESEQNISALFSENVNNKNYNISIPYKNGKSPGILFIDDERIDERFLKMLLEHHFNYEMAKDPALNLRVQICINQINFIMVLDIYDDRGFDIYYIESCE